MARMVRRALKVLAVWLALSVLLALLVDKVRRARRVQPEPMERLVNVGRPVHRVRPVQTGPRVIQDRQVPRAHRAR
jgi:hypothetical protein